VETGPIRTVSPATQSVSATCRGENLNTMERICARPHARPIAATTVRRRLEGADLAAASVVLLLAFRQTAEACQAEEAI
jgi:hypothetical protein